MRALHFLLCFSIGLHLVPAQKADSIFPFNMNKSYYGLISSHYPHVITPAIYKDMRQVYGGGMYTANKRGKYGVVDTSGKELVKMDYTEADDKWDPATKKAYVYLKKPGEQILVDQKGTVVAKNLPEIKTIWNNYIIVQPQSRDTTEARLYYSDGTQYQKEGLLDIKGTWIEKPTLKVFEPINNQLMYIVDYTKVPYKARIYDRSLKEIDGNAYGDILFGKALENDSLMKLKRILAFTNDHVLVLDSNGKELSRQVHTKFDVKASDEGEVKKGFRYNGEIFIEEKYDNVSLTDNYLVGSYSKTQKSDIYDRRGKFLFTRNFGKIFVLTNDRDKQKREGVFGEDKTGTYLLNSKLEKISPALLSVRTIEYNETNEPPFFVCEAKKKFGVLDMNGKVIVPILYSDAPEKYDNVIRVATLVKNDHGKDYYNLKAELIAKACDEVKESKTYPGIFLASKDGSCSVLGGSPLKTLVPFGVYTSVEEYEEHTGIIAKKDDKVFVLGKDLQSVNKEPGLGQISTADNTTFVIKLQNNKYRMLGHDRPEPTISFDHIETFQNSVDSYDDRNKDTKFLVRNNSKYGIVNNKSELLVNTEWDTIISIGKCAALRKGRTYYLTNEKFQVDMNAPLDSIILEPFSNPYHDHHWRAFKVQAKKNGKWGVFDLPKHEWIIYPNFENVVNVLGEVHSAQRYFSTKINKWLYLVDAEKDIIYGDGYDSITPITDDARLGRYPDLNKNLLVYKNGKYGIIDPKGKILHKCDGNFAKPLSYILHYYPSEREHVLGYVWNIGGVNKQFISHPGDSIEQETVDANGNTVLKKVLTGRYYDQQIVGGKWGMVDANGKELIPIVYDDMKIMFSGGEGVGFVRSGYSDTLPDYDFRIYPVFLKKDGKWGVAEWNGKIIVPVAHDNVDDAWINDERVIRLESNGKLGYTDLVGNEIVPTAFSGERVYGNYYNRPELTLFQKNGVVSSYTLPVISSTRQVRYDENGSKIYVNDTIIIEQKNFTGGTYGFWDQRNHTWALEPVYEDIRLLQEFEDMEDKRAPERASVTGKYTKELISFIKAYEPFEIKQNGKWGAYVHGKGIILKPEYDEIKIEKEEIITKQGGVEKRFDLDGKPK